jgi:hypothetical protein
MRKTFLIGMCATLNALFIVGCGSPVVTTYLKQSASEVFFVQYSSQGASLDGSLTIAVFTDSTDSAVAGVRIPFTGTQSDDLLTLHLGTSGAAVGVVGTVFGSIAGGVLTIALPQTNATLVNEVMHSSTQAAYDQSIHALNVTACTNSNMLNGTSTAC